MDETLYQLVLDGAKTVLSGDSHPVVSLVIASCVVFAVIYLGIKVKGTGWRNIKVTAGPEQAGTQVAAKQQALSETDNKLQDYLKQDSGNGT